MQYNRDHPSCLFFSFLRQEAYGLGWTLSPFPFFFRNYQSNVSVSCPTQPFLRSSKTEKKGEWKEGRLRGGWSCWWGFVVGDTR